MAPELSHGAVRSTYGGMMEHHEMLLSPGARYKTVWFPAKKLDQLIKTVGPTSEKRSGKRENNREHAAAQSSGHGVSAFSESVIQNANK
ncbi:hypothetical protein VTJ04DRAFT_6179 [Mycothermus thermophilus]|uniref:uncharacterized protein n=1 Tax=Humicola insolens TaxID=85995 RepID=UPI003744643F